MAAQYAYQQRNVHDLDGWYSAMGNDGNFIKIQQLSVVNSAANDQTAVSPTASSWQQPTAGSAFILGKVGAFRSSSPSVAEVDNNAAVIPSGPGLTGGK
jgi:hypothetical protein